MTDVSHGTDMASSREADLRGRRNRAIILLEIRRSGPISRRGLHEKTGMRPNTVGEIIGDLLEQGVVEEVGAITGRRGRRRQLVDLTADAHVLGAEIFEGVIRVGVMNLRGELLDFKEEKLRSHRKASVLDTLMHLVRPLREGKRVIGMGLAVAGVVNSTEGLSVRIAHFTDWKNVPLKKMLEDEFKIPVTLSNLTDVRLVALKHQGVIEPGMTAALVVIEAGAIGCGIVAEGHNLRGAVEASSELGQTRLDVNGKRVRLEDLTDLKWLRGEMRRLGGQTPKDLEALFAGKSKAAAQTCENLIDQLGLALANMALVIKPSNIWLTGSFPALGKAFVTPLRKAVRSNLITDFASVVKVNSLEQGADAGVMGAGGLILDDLFAMPEVRYF